MNNESMKFSTLFFIITVLITASGCKKDKFTTKPQLTFKTVSPNPIPNNSVFRFEIGFTDKEGDIVDTLFINRISRVCPTQVIFNLSTNTPVYTATSFQEGLFEISYAYNLNNVGFPNITSCTNRTDTSVFHFWIKDKAGNVSDTLVTPPVIFLR